jgi:hypothetical protein
MYAASTSFISLKQTQVSSVVGQTVRPVVQPQIDTSAGIHSGSVPASAFGSGYAVPQVSATPAMGKQKLMNEALEFCSLEGLLKV